MIAGIDIVHLVLVLIGIGAVCGLLWWLVGFAGEKGVLPQPFLGFAQVAIAIVAVLLLISLILELIGHPILGTPILRGHW